MSTPKFKFLMKLIYLILACIIIYTIRIIFKSAMESEKFSFYKVKILPPNKPESFNSTKFLSHSNNYSKSKKTKHIKLVILVLSKASDFASRNNIRQTWNNINKENFSTEFFYKAYFVVAFENIQSSTNVIEENNKYNDIIILNYIKESYFNLTRKVIGALKYVRIKHKNSLFVAKTDTDTLINWRPFINFLIEIENKSVDYTGCIKKKGVIIKNKNNINYEPNNVNNGSVHYHPYARGYGYIVRTSLLSCMSEAVRRLPLYINEDAYVGALVHYCSGIIMERPKLFTKNCALNRKRLRLDKNIDVFKDCLFIHRVSQKDYLKYHSILTKIS